MFPQATTSGLDKFKPSVAESLTQIAIAGKLCNNLIKSLLLAVLNLHPLIWCKFLVYCIHIPFCATSPLPTPWFSGQAGDIDMPFSVSEVKASGINTVFADLIDLGV